MLSMTIPVMINGATLGNNLAILEPGPYLAAVAEVQS